MSGEQETYWRGKDPGRVLLKIESSEYTMTLLDYVRTPYWSQKKEDFFNMLMHVMEFP